MNEVLRSILLGTSGLWMALLVSGYLTLARGNLRAGPTHSTLVLIASSVLLQTVHFIEELRTGFHIRFPELLGLAPWPASFFVTFNVAWLGLFTLCALSLAPRRPAALVPLWFLGLAGVLNGAAHPALALVVRGYFPGLVTSPLVGVAGLLVLRRLGALTSDSVSARG